MLLICDTKYFSVRGRLAINDVDFYHIQFGAERFQLDTTSLVDSCLSRISPGIFTSQRFNCFTPDQNVLILYELLRRLIL